MKHLSLLEMFGIVVLFVGAFMLASVILHFVLTITYFLFKLVLTFAFALVIFLFLYWLFKGARYK